MFDSLFTTVMFQSCSPFTATHGWSTACCTGAPATERFHVHGYIEEGTTTTPFDMTVLNRLDRFSLALAAIERVGSGPQRLSRRGAASARPTCGPYGLRP